MLEEVKAVTSREKAELVKTAEAMKAEIVDLRKQRADEAKKTPAKWIILKKAPVMPKVN